MPTIAFPVPNRVFQKDKNTGVASFQAAHRDTSASYTWELKQGSTVVQTSSTGAFSGVTPGWYDLVLVDGGNEVDTISMGVGDVYIVAGQSNAVSPRQPSTYTVPVPSAPGKVIISDYYRQGFDTFRDPAVDPLTEIPAGGCAWIQCGIALNKPYPVMFVIIAQGNTTCYDWGFVYYTRLWSAWGIYRTLSDNGVHAVLWHQGESECSTPPRTDTYARLNGLITSMRNFTVTPWVVALNSQSYPPPSGYTHWPCRDAQQQVIDQWPHVYQGPDTDTIRTPGQPEFLGDALVAHGNLWAARLTALGL